MIDMKQYMAEFWTAYHGRPSPPDTNEELEDVSACLAELVRRTPHDPPQEKR